MSTVNKKDNASNGDSTRNKRAIILAYPFLAVGLLGLILYAFQASSFAQFASIVGVALAVAGGALLAGGLLGFLFGIPRTLQRETTEGATQNQGQGNGNQGSPHGIYYQANTNLEQISDWLTKILVGVGLTQISAMPGAIQNYAGYTAAGLGNFANSQVFAVALLAYFLIGGFLAGYLLTRLFLPKAFYHAEVESLTKQIAQVKSNVSELEKQVEIDARALSLVQHQLNPSPGEQPIPQEDINKAIAQASPGTRAQVFYQAQDMRSMNWREPQDKPKMERTIPIFRALIASDTGNEYHANHGQLGFALKDQRQPDWAEAESELTKAIEVRDARQGSGWLFYEFNRAICRIYLDKPFQQEQRSDERTKQVILADIKTAAEVPDITELIREQYPLKEWLELNGLISEI